MPEWKKIWHSLWGNYLNTNLQSIEHDHILECISIKSELQTSKKKKKVKINNYYFTNGTDIVCIEKLE